MQVSLSIVDGTYGRPAEGLVVELHRIGVEAGPVAAPQVTDAAGQVMWVETAGRRGRYRILVELDRYFGGLGMAPFQTEIQVGFRVFDDDESVQLMLMITPTSSVMCRLSGDIGPA